MSSHKKEIKQSGHSVGNNERTSSWISGTVAVSMLKPYCPAKCSKFSYRFI